MVMVFDPAKNALNIKNHGIDLSFGDRVMADPNAIETIDDTMDYGEERWFVLGLVDGVVYRLIYKDVEEGFRYISLQEATKRETDHYLKEVCRHGR